MVRSYPILTTGGGLTGTFNALATVGLPTDFQSSLSYTSTTAFLNLRAQLVPDPTPPTPTPPTVPPILGLPPISGQPSTASTPPPLPIFTVNQLNVGRAIDNFFNNGSALPPAVVSLFNFTGNNLTSALDQLSGEAATGAQKVGFQLTDQFLNLMVDPFVDGRCGIGGTDQPPPTDQPFVRDCPPVYERGWTAWGGGYGGGNRTTGNLATIGSHDSSASTFGFLAGLDYHYSPDTVLGFAVAGGGTYWSLSQRLGGGRSDAVQAGVGDAAGNEDARFDGHASGSLGERGYDGEHADHRDVHPFPKNQVGRDRGLAGERHLCRRRHAPLVGCCSHRFGGGTGCRAM